VDVPEPRRYRVSRIVIDSAGSVIPPAADRADVVPVMMLEFVAFWFPTLWLQVRNVPNKAAYGRNVTVSAELALVLMNATACLPPGRTES
jgi:hypothetical protein